MDALHAKEAAQYTVSIALYGGPLDPHASQDVPNPSGTDTSSSANHVGIAVHAATPAPPTCRLHHARCPSQVRFIYDPRPAQPFFGRDPVLRARCELSTLAADDLTRANAVLAAYGANEDNLPWFGAGNCHDWTAGAVRALEAEGLAGPCGAGEYWASAIGKGPVAMAAGWAARRGVVVGNESFGLGSGEEADARWVDREEVKVGRLDLARSTGLADLLARRVPGGL